MSVKGRAGWTPGGIAVSGMLKELVDTYKDANELRDHLQQGLPNGTTVQQTLRTVLRGLDVVETPDEPRIQVEAVAREVLARISEPEEYVALLAGLLGSSPGRLAELVPERVGNAPVVAKDDFVRMTANVSPPLRRVALNDEERSALANLPNTLADLGLPNSAAKVKSFIDSYQDITGSKVVFEPESLVRLFRQEGDHIRSYLQRSLRLSLLGGADSAADVTNLERFTESLLLEIGRHGMLPETSVIGEFQEAGLDGALYRAAESFDDVQRDAVADPTIVDKVPARVDRGTIFGKAAGDAAPLLEDLSATATLVAVAPDTDQIERIRAHCLRGGLALVLGERVEGLELPQICYLSPDEDVDLNAAIAARHIREQSEAKRQSAHVSVAEHMCMGAPPTEINEVMQWAKKESTKYRLLRLKNAVERHLADEHSGASVGDISKWSLDFARNLIGYTHGVDNFKDNAKWQKLARKAVEASSPEVQAITDRLGLDIMFASWFGIREYNEAPSYFADHTSPLEFPAHLEHLDEQNEHTFDKDVYAEVRLDHITTQILKAKDSNPEVFLGSREEMQLFYRAQGYEFDCTTHDTNGTDFHFFRSTVEGQKSIMVMQGVDSEARLLQLASLMKVNGVDPKRCVIRGEMSRVRENNRSLLEHRIMDVIASGDVEKKIAGVVVGNKNESIDAIASAAGVEPSALEVSDHQAGPFRFRSVEVKPAGADPDDPPQVILAFAPAYGELSQDLVEAAAMLGADNFMLAGAGGSLNAGDELNSIHRIVEAMSEDGTRLGFANASSPNVTASPFLDEIALPDGVAKIAANWFSPTPLEQDRAWLERIRNAMQAAGNSSADVDQETFSVFKGLHLASLRVNGKDADGSTDLLAGAPANERRFNLLPSLVQSDVVGSGALASGTVKAGYGGQIRSVAKTFVDTLGIGSVASAGGWTPVDDAKPGLMKTAVTRTPGGAESVASVLPNMDTMTTSWIASADQFKGEKRPIHVVAERFGDDEEEFMRELLSTVNPADVWIVVDAADTNNERIRDMAKQYDGALAPKSQRVRRLAEEFGFETVVMSLDSERSSIRGRFDFLLGYDRLVGDEESPGKLDTVQGFMRHDNANEDPNFGIGRTIVLGASPPPTHEASKPPHGLNEEDLSRFVEMLAEVHEEVAVEQATVDDNLNAPDQKAAVILRDKSAASTIRKMATRWSKDAVGKQAASERDVQAIIEHLNHQASIQGYHYTAGLDAAGRTQVIDGIKEETRLAFDGGVQMFGNGLTHRFPGLIPAITERYQQNIESGAIKALPARTGEAQLDAPRFFPFDGLNDYFQVEGTNQMRKPIWWAGASRSSWPLISKESQMALHLFVEIVFKTLADRKDDFAHLTGGTAYGFEKIVHDVAYREGWHTLGVLAQNTSVSDDKFEPDDRVHNWTFCGVSWFGIARSLTKEVKHRDGFVLNGCGGGIAADQIGVQMALNANAMCLDGYTPDIAELQRVKNEKLAKKGKAPEPLSEDEIRLGAGASVAMAEKFPGRSFGTLEQVCEEMGLRDLLATMKNEAKLKGPISLASDLEPLAASLGIDVDTIRKEYFDD